MVIQPPGEPHLGRRTTAAGLLPVGGDGANGQNANGQDGGIVINGVSFPPNTSGTFPVGNSGETVTLENGKVVAIDGPDGRHISLILPPTRGPPNGPPHRLPKKRGSANGGNAVGGNGGNGQDGQNSVGQNGGVSVGGGDADGDDNVAGVDIPQGTNGTFQIGSHTVVIENGHIVSVDGQPFGNGASSSDDGQDGQNGQNGQDGQNGTATPGQPGVVIGGGSANAGSATTGKGGRGGSSTGAATTARRLPTSPAPSSAVAPPMEGPLRQGTAVTAAPRTAGMAGRSSVAALRTEGVTSLPKNERTRWRGGYWWRTCE